MFYVIEVFSLFVGGHINFSRDLMDIIDYVTFRTHLSKI